MQEPITPTEKIGDKNITAETTTQSDAVLGQPVKWTKTISLDIPSNIILTLPENAEEISVFSISHSEMQGALENQESPIQKEPLASEKQVNLDYSYFFFKAYFA